MWRGVLEDAGRIDALRARRTRLDAIAAAVHTSGASVWADSLANDRTEGTDRWTPESWRASWNWARAAGHIRRLSDRAAFEEVSARRAALEAEQRTLLDELVRVRTFIGLKQGITERAESALTKYAMKVRQRGAGTGVAADRHRRGIRDATLEAAEAVPCWILPCRRAAAERAGIIPPGHHRRGQPV